MLLTNWLLIKKYVYLKIYTTAEKIIVLKGFYVRFGEIKLLQKKRRMIVVKSIKKLNKLQLAKEAKCQQCQYYLFENEIFEVK